MAAVSRALHCSHYSTTNAKREIDDDLEPGVFCRALRRRSRIEFIERELCERPASSEADHSLVMMFL